MGRRQSFASDFEAWRSAYRRDLGDRYDEEFVDLVMAELDDEIDAFGADDRDVLAVIAEGRAQVKAAG